MPTQRREWKYDLSCVPSRFTRDKSLPKPPGFESDLVDGSETNEKESAIISADKEAAAKMKQAMALAYSPGKSLLSTGFMLWMSGSSIQIFSIMMTGMAFINPIKAISTINTTFRQFEGIDTKIPKLIFLGLQILSLCVALYKMSMMGLLPRTSADWIHHIPVQHITEYTSAPL